MHKILAVVITSDWVEPESYQSIIQQDYPNFSTIIHIEKPQFSHYDATVKKYMNCVDNRNKARKMALASDADKFLFMDSDIVLPPDGMRRLASHQFDIVGGWYKELSSDRWITGKWVADNVFFNLLSVERDIIEVDMVGMGCAMISRQALEQIPFETGVDIFLKNTSGRELLLGECGIFGNRAAEKGYRLYMDGNVICKHLVRK